MCLTSVQGTPSGVSPGGSPDRGSQLFSAYCASCHGEFGRGDGPIAARLMRDYNVRPVDFSVAAWQQSRNDAQLTAVLRSGGQAMHRTQFMPAWGQTLTHQQESDLIAFLRELGKPGSSGYVPASTLPIQQKLELGRTLYSLHCLACHGPRGKGDGPLMEGRAVQAPNLALPETLRERTDSDLLRYASSGVFHGHVDLDLEQHRWWHGQLNADEQQALVLYIRSLAVGGPR